VINYSVKKSDPKLKSGEIVRVYEVIGLKDTQRVNVRWNDDTVSINVRLADLTIVERL
jgi:hypothetical protein